MTTIAYRDGVMAADTLVTSNGKRDGQKIKIARNAAGDLAGAAGNSAVCQQFLEWFSSGEKHEPPEFDEELGNGLIVRADGTIELYMKHGVSKSTADFYSLGSGYQIALGAMSMGATAEIAVRKAMEFDTESGGNVTVLKHEVE